MRKITKIHLPPHIYTVTYDITEEEMQKEWEKAEGAKLKKNEKLDGMCDSNGHNILLADRLRPGMPQLHVLMHEIAHAIDFTGELDIKTHARIVALENCITNFILHNKTLIKQLWEEQKKDGAKN